MNQLNGIKFSIWNGCQLINTHFGNWVSNKLINIWIIVDGSGLH